MKAQPEEFSLHTLLEAQLAQPGLAVVWAFFCFRCAIIMNVLALNLSYIMFAVDV